MFDIIENVLKVATSLLDLFKGASALSRERMDKLADLLQRISETLSAVSASVRTGHIPHGECGKLITYSEELPKLIKGHVTDQKADELGDLLRSSYAVERLAGALAAIEDRDPHLAKLDEAAGKFSALSHILRAKA